WTTWCGNPGSVNLTGLAIAGTPVPVRASVLAGGTFGDPHRTGVGVSIPLWGSEQGVRTKGQNKGSEQRVRTKGQNKGSEQRVRTKGQIKGSGASGRGPWRFRASRTPPPLRRCGRRRGRRRGRRGCPPGAARCRRSGPRAGR